MRIAILGPLWVTDAGGAVVEIGGARLRALLIRLALDAGRPVGTDALCAAVWDGDPPATLERVLFHLVQEYARHVGHLDIVCELAGAGTGE